MKTGIHLRLYIKSSYFGSGQEHYLCLASPFPPPRLLHMHAKDILEAPPPPPPNS